MRGLNARPSFRGRENLIGRVVAIRPDLEFSMPPIGVVPVAARLESQFRTLDSATRDSSRRIWKTKLRIYRPPFRRFR